MKRQHEDSTLLLHICRIPLVISVVKEGERREGQTASGGQSPRAAFVRYSKRYLRWLAMIKCFVDDSGNHDPDPYFILAGWTGTIGTWDQFADDWDKELAKPKPIDYYKHSEAAGGSGCFEKFTNYEATQKTIDMSRVIASYAIYPFVVTVP